MSGFGKKQHEFFWLFLASIRNPAAVWHHDFKHKLNAMKLCKQLTCRQRGHARKRGKRLGDKQEIMFW